MHSKKSNTLILYSHNGLYLTVHHSAFNITYSGVGELEYLGRLSHVVEGFVYLTIKLVFSSIDLAIYPDHSEHTTGSSLTLHSFV